MELKRLSAYLPYGIDMIVYNLNGKDEKVELNEETISYWHPDYLTLKPILRPLDDLIKDIRIGNEEFKPLVKLASMYCGDEGDGLYTCFQEYEEFNGKIKDIGKRGDLFYLNYRWYEDSDAVLEEFTFSNSIGKMGFILFTLYMSQQRNDVEKINMIPLPVNQLCYFEYLFKWHFDIFGLIEKDLAIDINTL